MYTATADSAVIALLSVLPLLGLSIGERRKRALKRIGAGIYLVVFIYTAGTVLGFITFVWTVLDLLAEGIFNRDWFADDGRIADWISRWFDWTAKVQTYIATGNGEFEWLP